jgi:GNAT superfamily N-acetyltransferase
MPRSEVVTIADRADLAPVIAEWLWHEWWHRNCTIEQTRAAISASVARLGPPQFFVLLVNDEPVGTSSLVTSDLDERPELTPWLANVFVAPKARRRGHVIPLIRVVEDVCRSAGIATLWLHTEHADHIYARAGWQRVETVERAGRIPVTLMRRDLRPTV